MTIRKSFLRLNGVVSVESAEFGGKSNPASEFNKAYAERKPFDIQLEYAIKKGIYYDL